MCGVFGFISKNGKGPDPRRLAKIAVETERRGPHAFGFAWIAPGSDGRPRLHMFKQTGRISDHLGLLAMAADARMLIGHCRYATQGDPRNNLNNHPHSCDGGWLIHNGMLPNYHEIIEERGLMPVTDCDSEVFALIAERAAGTLADRMVEAATVAEESPTVLMGLWPRTEAGAAGGKLVAVVSGNPLTIGHTKRGTYLASLAGGMPPGAVRVDDGSVLEFELNSENKPRKGGRHGKANEAKNIGSARGGSRGIAARGLAVAERRPADLRRSAEHLFPVPNDADGERLSPGRRNRPWGF